MFLSESPTVPAEAKGPREEEVEERAEKGDLKRGSCGVERRGTPQRVRRVW